MRRRRNRKVPWRGMSPRTAAMVRPYTPARHRYALSRYDTSGISADGKSWTIESGDTGSGIAKAVTGDANRWRELKEANPEIAKRPDPNNWGFVAWPGEVVALPESWWPPEEEPVPEEVETQASVTQARATLVAWGNTDGVEVRPLRDYGLNTKDFSGSWSNRDVKMGKAFAKWWGMRDQDGQLDDNLAENLRDWADQAAKGKKQKTSPVPEEQEPTEEPPAEIPAAVELPGLGTVTLPTVTTPAPPEPQPTAAEPPPAPAPVPSLPTITIPTVTAPHPTPVATEEPSIPGVPSVTPPVIQTKTQQKQQQAAAGDETVALAGLAGLAAYGLGLV
jgi:hypothetical protein